MTNSQPHHPSARWAQVQDRLSHALAEVGGRPNIPLRSPYDVGELAERIRELNTPRARDTTAADAVFGLFDLDLCPAAEVLYEAAATLRTVADGRHLDRIASLASNPAFGASRSPLLAWLLEHGGHQGLGVVVDQLCDPSVRASGIRYLRQYHPPPEHLVGTIEPFLDDPDAAVRTEAERTVNLLYLAIFAPSLSR
ncbi:hypothetical protein [Gordonia alkanivorans]|uniref:hypothetical protein n=1 Tax=Gordonia alkanivorans TaxID=84096 RepID=UPI0012DEC3F5|nr:hypothetical protein [Gordonia alkanivorans]